MDAGVVSGLLQLAIPEVRCFKGMTRLKGIASKRPATASGCGGAALATPPTPFFSSLLEASGPAVPQDIWYSPPLVLVSGHHEKGVGETVQILDRVGAHRLATGERDQGPLGAPADGPRDVELRGAGRSSGQDEV